MNWIMLVIKVIAELPGMLKIIEKAFDGVPDSSEEKKAMAKEFVKSIVRGLTGISGPDLDKLLSQVLMVVDPLIDLMVSIFFPHDEEETS